MCCISFFRLNVNILFWIWHFQLVHKKELLTLSAQSVPLAVDKNNHPCNGMWKIPSVLWSMFLCFYCMCLLTLGSSRARPPAGWILEHPFPAKLSQSRSESLWLAVHSFGCSHPWAAGQTNQMDKHEVSNSLINVYTVNACNILT